ncbi:hypothetical protein AVEN_133326-1 [Araneus ventricosus]|uniref:Uncharacterized protein n=1 Tax=Araneus ventricosus TaxID=182803 RepID=A0A4Y2DJZ8_ARAVE|nr:hypothetical protein AVEN_133326-1 [Araneus ventricosus]
MRHLRRIRFSSLPPKKILRTQPKMRNRGGPTASYRGCPKFPKIKNNEVRKEFSYAAAAKKATTVNNPNLCGHTAPPKHPEHCIANLAQLKDEIL